jgi:alpha-1,3-rhamnosyl/mannosyltransferase
MSAMRVVIDARMLQGWTGIERYLKGLLRHLPAAAPDLHVLAAVQPQDAPELARIAPDIEPIPVRAPPFSIAEQGRLAVAIRRAAADLVHFVAPNAPLAPVGPRVTTFHDLTLLDFPETAGGVIPRAKLTVFRRVMAHGVRSSRLLLVPSKATATSLVARFPTARGKIRITYPAGPAATASIRPGPVPSTAAPSTAVPPAGPAEPYLLHVGNAYPYKNLERLVRAFAMIADSHPGLRLVLVGRIDEHHRFLARRAHELGVGDRVTLTGQVCDEELARLYTGARLFILASLSEGFGLPALEAMAYGTPTLVARSTSLPEVGGDAVAYFDPLDVYDLAASIHRLLDDGARLRELSSAGLRRSARFSWTRTAEETVAAYRAAVAGPAVGDSDGVRGTAVEGWVAELSRRPDSRERT